MGRVLAAGASPPARGTAPLSYGEPAGVPELRSELAGYLARSRGVECDADDILIVGGLAPQERVSLLEPRLARDGLAVRPIVTGTLAAAEPTSPPAS